MCRCACALPITVGFVYVEGGVCLDRLVWFVVDEYYCSETTTTQVCLGYISLGCYRAAIGIHSADEGRPAWNSCPPFAWFALRTPFSIYAGYFITHWFDSSHAKIVVVLLRELLTAKLVHLCHLSGQVLGGFETLRVEDNLCNQCCVSRGEPVTLPSSIVN